MSPGPLEPVRRAEFESYKHSARIINRLRGLAYFVGLIIAGFAISGVSSNRSDDLRDSQRAQCSRSNYSRIALVHNYRSDIVNLQGDVRNLRSDVVFLRVLGGSDSGTLIAAKLNAVADKEQAIDDKRESIRSAVRAVAPVALSPGSPVADCDKAVHAG